MDIPPLRGKQLNALRAVAGAATGLRLGGFPSVMPLLVEMGLVEEREASRISHQRGWAWFLTTDGCSSIRAYGADEA